MVKRKEQVITEALNAKADDSKNEENAVKVEKAAKEEDIVIVYCGIPMGLRLQLKTHEVMLKGVPMSHIVSAHKGEGFLPSGKFGETPLPREDWEEILHTYAKHDFIVNGVVYAEENEKSGREKAKEKSEKKLGFEQADPKKGKTKPVENKEG